MSGVPPRVAFDCAVKPVPVIVAVKEPRGKAAGLSDAIAGAGEFWRVTIAVPAPPGPVAVTVSVPDPGIDVGAV